LTRKRLIKTMIKADTAMLYPGSLYFKIRRDPCQRFT
jgi:hypothetical protein